MGTLMNQLVWDNNNNTNSSNSNSNSTSTSSSSNSNSNSNNNSSSSNNNKKQPAMTTLSNPRFCCEGLTSSQGQLEQKKLQEAERHLNALDWMDQYATLCKNDVFMGESCKIHSKLSMQSLLCSDFFSRIWQIFGLNSSNLDHFGHFQRQPWYLTLPDRQPSRLQARSSVGTGSLMALRNLHVSNQVSKEQRAPLLHHSFFIFVCISNIKVWYENNLKVWLKVWPS